MLRTLSLITASRAGLLALAFAALLGCAGRPGPVTSAMAAECSGGLTLVAAGCAPRASASGADIVADAAPAPDDFTAIMRDVALTAPAIRAALSRWQAEDQKIDVTRSALAPSLVAYGEGAARATHSDATGTVGDNPFSYGVRASLPLFDGGTTLLATRGQAAMARAAHEAASDELAATLLDIAAAAAAVTRADAGVRVRTRQVAALRTLHSAVTHEISSGTSTRTDADQVLAQISQAEAAIRQAQTDRADAMRAFAEISGHAPTRLGPVPSIASRLPADKGEAERRAARDNPKIRRALALSDAAGLARKSADALGQPQISLDMDLGRTGDLSGTSPAQTAASLQLRFELPIGPTGGNEARRRQKEFEQSAAGYDLAAASQGVFAGVDAALERLDLVRQSLALARKAARHAADVAQGMATERLLGDRTVFDEIGAINGVAEADMAAAGMAYELTVAEHLLAAQTGQIAAIYGVHISGSAAN